MKYKRLLVLVAAIVVLALGLFLHSKWHTLFPSQEMKDLRQLEVQLDLPKSKYRTEEDLGLHTDSKGALHYARHIALSYEDVTVLDSLRTKLLNNSWHEQAGSTAEDTTSFSFVKGSGSSMRCIGGFTRPANTDGITLYISLQAAGEYSCNPAPGV